MADGSPTPVALAAMRGDAAGNGAAAGYSSFEELDIPHDVLKDIHPAVSDRSPLLQIARVQLGAVSMSHFKQLATYPEPVPPVVTALGSAVRCAALRSVAGLLSCRLTMYGLATVTRRSFVGPDRVRTGTSHVHPCRAIHPEVLLHPSAQSPHGCHAQARGC